MPRAVLTAGLLSVAALVAGPAALAQDDAYLQGYVAAVLEQRFGLEGVDAPVRDGVLRIDPAVFPEAQRYEVVSTLSGIEGLRVELVGPARDAPQPAPEPPPDRERVAIVSGALGVLPREALFDEVIADPRWPRFSASLQFFDDDPVLETVGAANFGGTLPVYGWTALGWQWQVGVQAGVFSIFDLEADSKDLINADYLVGIPLSLRNGPFSTQLRIFHQSSHLGDEFLLREATERINLSYEVVDVLASYELFDLMRVYGGVGTVIHSEPDLDPLRVQAGAEVTSPDPLVGDVLFPIVAFDFQSTEEADWRNDYSVRAGFEFRTAFLDERRLQLLFEYFNGRSPNGQFFDRDQEYFGTGLHFFF